MRELQEPGKRSSPAAIENPKPAIEMREPTADSAIAYAVALLRHYGFELRGYTAEEVVKLWLKNYPANWVRLSVIEALYQGRYKAVSVEQILAVWARRGHPLHRFNHEFERLVCRKLPQKLTAFSNKRSRSAGDREVVGASASLPDLIVEPNLSPLALSLPETFTESAKLEATPHELAATVKQETVPIQELTEAIIQSDNQPLKAKADAGTRPTHDANWSRSEVSKQPIHQFTPPPDSSNFYLKLKAVVQHQEEIPANNGTSITDESESELPPSRLDAN
jgi:hypothetical protein